MYLSALSLAFSSAGSFGAWQQNGYAKGVFGTSKNSITCQSREECDMSPQNAAIIILSIGPVAFIQMCVVQWIRKRRRQDEERKAAQDDN